MPESPPSIGIGKGRMVSRKGVYIKITYISK
jgi:hypothetical protein